MRLLSFGGATPLSHFLSLYAPALNAALQDTHGTRVAYWLESHAPSLAADYSAGRYAHPVI